MKQSSLNDSHAESRAEILADCIANVCLNEAPDLRSLASLHDEPFSSRGAYDLLHHSNMPNPDVMLIWSTKLPTKVKFFAWLLCHGRLNTRDYLYRRSIRPLEEPYCERCPTVTESDVHLFFNCPLAQGTWSALGFAPNPAIVRQPWLLCLSADLPEQVHVDVIPLLLWHNWKARNAMIFDHIDSTPRNIIRRVVQDIDAWSCRFNQLKPDLLVWKTWLQSCY